MEVFVWAINATVWNLAEITLVSSLVRNVSIGFDVVTLFDLATCFIDLEWSIRTFFCVVK